MKQKSYKILMLYIKYSEHFWGFISINEEVSKIKWGRCALDHGQLITEIWCANIINRKVAM